MKMPDDRNELRRLLQALEDGLENEHHRIVVDFIEWRLRRTRTIEKFNDIIEILNKTQVASNYGKCIGIIFEVIGAITSIIAVLMESGGFSSAQTLMCVGCSLRHSGSLLRFISNAFICFASAIYLSQIQEAIKRDQELSSPRYCTIYTATDQYIARKVNEASNRLIKWTIHFDILNLFSNFTMMYFLGRRFFHTVDVMRRGSYCMDIGADDQPEDLLRYGSRFDMNSESVLSISVKSLQLTWQCVRIYRNLFANDNYSHFTVANSTAPGNTNELTNDRATESPKLQIERHFSSEPPTQKVVSTFCAFQTTDIAVSVADLATAIMAIRSSKHHLSRILHGISNFLAQELQATIQLFTEL